MYVKLFDGDVFEKDGKWWHLSADATETIGPFSTREEAERDLRVEVTTMLFED